MTCRDTVSFLLCAAAALSTACAHAPPPADRVQAVAVSAPPPPRRENAGQAPRPGYVWIPGYWNRVNDQYVWVMGYWSMPPSGFTSWDATHWIHDQARGWVLVRGRWR